MPFGRCALVLSLALAVTPLSPGYTADVTAEYGVAAGGDIRDSTISIGFTPEQLHGLMREAHASELRELSAKLAVTEAAVAGFFHILEQEQVSLELLPVKLAEIARRHKETLARMAALELADPKVQSLVDAARQAVEVGDYDRAEALLDQAEELGLAAIREGEAIAKRVREAIDQRRLSAAAVRAQKGEVALIRLRYREAAEHFAQAAELVPVTSSAERLGYLDQRAEALYKQGGERGDNVALEEAIAVYRQLLQKRPRERMPLDWAMTQNELGCALAARGEREAGTARLEEAIAAFRAASKEFPHERKPLEWAQIANNLGTALARLGEREASAARLEEAVAAFRAALEERPRREVPLEWAQTQNNLGLALATLGGREPGTAHLQEAVMAFQAALEERTRERVPLDWALTQNNLGFTLTILGQRESGTDRLQGAVAAYQAALEEFTRERVPLDWARTQNNLGNALLNLGGREVRYGAPGASGSGVPGRPGGVYPRAGAP
jgi:tetratricopeptide (TPR) repeat protein